MSLKLLWGKMHNSGEMFLWLLVGENTKPSGFWETIYLVYLKNGSHLCEWYAKLYQRKHIIGLFPFFCNLFQYQRLSCRASEWRQWGKAAQVFPCIEYPTYFVSGVTVWPLINDFASYYLPELRELAESHLAVIVHSAKPTTEKLSDFSSQGEKPCCCL